MVATGAVATVVAAGRGIVLHDVSLMLILFLGMICGFAILTASSSLFAATSTKPLIYIPVALGLATACGWAPSLRGGDDMWMMWFQLSLAGLVMIAGIILRLHGYRFRFTSRVKTNISVP
jgi:hypothetical protein